MDEKVLQFGAFTFTRRPRGRVTIDIDTRTQILLRPRELTTQEAVQLARFLIRDEELLRDVGAEESEKIVQALLSGEEQDQ